LAELAEKFKADKNNRLSGQPVDDSNNGDDGINGYQAVGSM